MKSFSNYIPFVLISAILYSGAFYYQSEKTLFVPIPLNSGKQSIQVQFVTLPEAAKPPAEMDGQLDTINQEKKIKTEQPTELPEVVKEPVQETEKPLITAPSESEVKLINKDPQEVAQAKTPVEETIVKTEVAETAASEKQQQAKTTQIEPVIAPTAPTKQEITEVQQTLNAMPEKALESATEAQTASAQEEGVLQEAVVISGNKPVYPKRAILRNQQGRVVVQLTITSQGKPQNPKIITSSGYSILDKAVLSFINKELFKPALRGEQKVSSEQVFAFRFQLN